MSDLINRLRHQASCLVHGQVEQVDSTVASIHDAVDRIEELEVVTAGMLAALQEITSEYRKTLEGMLAPQNRFMVERTPAIRRAQSAIDAALNGG